MSTFEVNVVRVSKVTDHENADRLSLIWIGLFAVVSAKLEDGSHRYKEGDLVVYVPEGAVVPEHLLRQGFWDEEKNVGLLSGPNGDRVKAKKIRSILSQGIIFPVEYKETDTEQGKYISNVKIGEWKEDIVGMNVAEKLNITKYEPPIPAALAGDVYHLGNTVPKFDVENLQKFPDTFSNGQTVTITEKLHGTCTIVGVRFNEKRNDLFSIDDTNRFGFVASKGLGAKGLVFKDTENNRKGNLYVRTALKLDLFKKLASMQDWFEKIKFPFYHEVIGYDLIGEIYGPGVQDLHYGLKKPQFRAFSVRVLYIDRNMGSIEDFWMGEVKRRFFENMGVESVPVLYHGPFSMEKMEELRTGTSTDDPNQIREGIVISSNQFCDFGDMFEVGLMKFINPDYLTRKNKNATEYQ